VEQVLAQNAPIEGGDASEGVMTKEAKGGDLFIVDNSISGWTCLRYLHEWTEYGKKPTPGGRCFLKLRPRGM
jgi:hypothetical protein